jgi:hypothetical protein
MFRGFQLFGAAMTSISATSTSNYQLSLQQLQNDLQQEVNSGTISSSDETALSSALNDINSSLQGGSGSSGSSGAGSSSSGDLKSKLDSLIANEVSSGKLTQQQATELQGLFQNALGGNSQFAGSFTQAGDPTAVGPVPPGAVGGAGGATLTAAGPAGSGAFGNVQNPTAIGPVPPGAVGGAGGATLTAAGPAGSGSASNGTNDTSGTDSANQILQQFLQSLQSSAPVAYNANGGAAPINDSSSYLSSFLINYQS